MEIQGNENEEKIEIFELEKKIYRKKKRVTKISLFL